MTKKLFSLPAMVLVLVMQSLCPAQEAKPVVAVSFSGYEALRADVRYLGQLLDSPELAEALDGVVTLGTAGRGLQGLDLKRPWGAVVYTSDDEFSVAVFLPTNDIRALADTLGALNLQATEQDDGTYEVQTPMQPLVMKERAGWAVLVDQADTLDLLPEDPMQAIAPLPGKHDIAVMAHVSNLPESVRQMIIAQLGVGAALGMQQQPGETEEQYALRRAMTERSIQQVTTMINELDRFLFGLRIDADAGEAVIEVAVTALPDTKTAEQFAQLQQTTTNFAGFDQPGAAISANWSAMLTDDDVEQAKLLLNGVRSAAKEELQRQDLDDAEMAVAEQLLADLFEVLEENVEAKVTDAGMIGKIGPNQLTLVAGGYVADGPKIEGLLKQFLEQLVKDQPEAKAYLKLDAETHSGVNLHVLSVPVEELDEGAEPMRRLVGDRLDVIVGIGPNSLYLAAGRDVAGELKQIIDASQAAPGKAVSPLNASVALLPIVQLAATLAEDESVQQMAGMMALALGQSPEKDRLKFQTRPIRNGSMTTITLEEGVLRLIGTGVMMGQQMMMAPAGFDDF